MPKKVHTIDTETMDIIADMVLDKIRKKESAATKMRHGKLKANTRRLLRNYRALKDHCERSVYNADTIDEGDGYTFADIIDLINGGGGSSFKIESIRQSTVRTRIIIDHIDTMLNLYKAYCDNSQKEEDARRYRVIYWLYVAEASRTHDEIAVDEYTDIRTIYRDVDMAIERLTALIFGIDGINRTLK